MKAIMDAVHALSGQIQAQAKVNQQQKKVNHELTKQARFSPIMECKTIVRFCSHPASSSPSLTQVQAQALRILALEKRLNVMASAGGGGGADGGGSASGESAGGDDSAKPDSDKPAGHPELRHSDTTVAVDGTDS